MESGGFPGSLRFEVAESYEALSCRAQQFIVTDLRRRPDLILCASAGSTPTGTYERLAARASIEPGRFSKLRVLQIDEWGGLVRGHPATCEQDLRSKLRRPLSIRQERYIGFNTAAVDPAAECARIRRWLEKNGPIDLCILGLGVNGHVAMNEPSDALDPHAHIAKFTKSSLNHPMLRELKEKPRFGLTIGMADILSSKKLLLLVSGAHKRAALERLRVPQVTTRFPASFLWLHPDATILCDHEAAPWTSFKSIKPAARRRRLMTKTSRAVTPHSRNGNGAY